VNRPSRKEIKALVDKLKERPEGSSAPQERGQESLADKKTSRQIRKKGL